MPGSPRAGWGVDLHWRQGAVCTLCGRRLMRAESAWQVADILAGMPPPAGGLPDRVAYKTGTSYGHRDTWAIGFDGRHVIGVWMGRADGTPVPGRFGGELAAPVLFEAFSRVKPGLDPLPPPPPGTLIVTNSGAAAAVEALPARATRCSAPIRARRKWRSRPTARCSPRTGTLVLKVRDGRAPFTWLADGEPLAIGAREREVAVRAAGQGFVTLSVIDAQGRSAEARIRVQ